MPRGMPRRKEQRRDYFRGWIVRVRFEVFNQEGKAMTIDRETVPMPENKTDVGSPGVCFIPPMTLRQHYLGQAMLGLLANPANAQAGEFQIVDRAITITDMAIAAERKTREAKP
jgi:hypothetical protein